MTQKSGYRSKNNRKFNDIHAFTPFEVDHDPEQSYQSVRNFADNFAPKIALKNEIQDIVAPMLGKLEERLNTQISQNGRQNEYVDDETQNQPTFEYGNFTYRDQRMSPAHNKPMVKSIKTRNIDEYN